MKRKILSCLILLLTPIMVNAATFNEGDTTYTLNPVNINCPNMKTYSYIDDKIYLFDSTTGKIATLNDLNECIEVPIQEILDKVNDGEIWYGIDFDDNGDYYIVRQTLYTYINSLIKTTDTTIQQDKTYYVLDEEGYSEMVQNPTENNLANYYEDIIIAPPTSATIDKTTKYYENKSGYVELVTNPTEDNLFNYWIEIEYKPNNKTEKIEKITNEKILELLETNPFLGVDYDKKQDKFYYLFNRNDNGNYISAYDEDGTEIKLPDKAINYYPINDSLYSVIVELTEEKYGTHIYNKNFELLYSNESIELYFKDESDTHKNNILVFNSTTEKNEIYKLAEYKLLTGANQTYENKDLEFKFTGILSELTEVLVNNQKLDETNYTKKTGSTIITLKKEYLETLEKGTYTLTVKYSDNGSVSTTFNIPEKKIDDSIIDNPNDNTDDNKDENQNNNDNQPKEDNNNKSESDLTNNPQTFDGIQTSIIFAIISIIGLLFGVIYLKKQSKN